MCIYRDLEFTVSPAGIFLYFLQWPQVVDLEPGLESRFLWPEGLPVFMPQQALFSQRHSSSCLFTSNSRIQSQVLSDLRHRLCTAQMCHTELSRVLSHWPSGQFRDKGTAVLLVLFHKRRTRSSREVLLATSSNRSKDQVQIPSLN